MANTITLDTLVDTLTQVVVKFDILGDTAELTRYIIVNVSELSPVPSEVRLMRVQANLESFNARLYWGSAGAGTDKLIMYLPTAWQDWKFWQFGGIWNNVEVGKTGDILMTTSGVGTEHGTIILEMEKVFY